MWLILICILLALTACSKDSTTEPNNGNETSSATCQIIEPVNVDSIYAGARLTIKLKVKSGSSLVDQITYYANNTQIYQQNGQTNSNDTIFTFDWTTPTTANIYQLKAVIKDKDGKTNSSQTLSIKVFAQSGGDFIWTKRAGGGGNDYGNSITVDAQGNTFVAGSFSSASTFGNLTLYPSGDRDLYVAKIDPNGNYLWVRQAGASYMGGDNDYAYALALDTDNNILVTGSNGGNATFGSIQLTQSGYFVAKLDDSGNWLWVKPVSSRCDDICVDNNGNSYTVGGWNFTKLDALGNNLWTMPIGVSNNSGGAGYSIALDVNDNIYITGSFKGTVTFGNTTLTSSVEWSDGFIVKIDSNNNYLWAKSINSSEYGYCNDVAIDFQGNCYMAGCFIGTAQLGTISLTSYSDVKSSFISKLSTEGNFEWAKTIGDSAYSEINALALDNSGGCYLTGGFAGKVNFGAICLQSINKVDLFVTKINSSGSFIWARSAGDINAGSNMDENATYGRSIIVDNSGTCYITGVFSNVAYFGNTELTSAGSSDIFVTKIK